MNFMYLSIVCSIFLLVVSCKETPQNENPFVEKQHQTEQIIDDMEEIVDQLEVELQDLDKNYIETQIYIEDLQAKRDSLQELLNQINQQANDINNNNIKTSIEDVSKKLDELKRQKENITDNIELNRKKLDVSDQMISVLKNEQEMYEEQRQALWDKGAAPEEFTEVDSSLKKIKSKITNQESKKKRIVRKIEDLEECVSTIDKSRKTLNAKIRNEYSAQQILLEYIDVEIARITEQIYTINKELDPYQNKEKNLNNKIETVDTKIDYIEGEQQQLKESKKEIQKKNQNNEQKKQEKSKKTKQGVILVILIGIVLLLFYLYLVGKKRKSKNNY